MKILVKISNQIEITSNTLPKKLQQIIKADLTLDNPAYIQAEKMDKYSGHLERYIYLYQQEGMLLILPRGYIYNLIKILRAAGQEFQIDDQRLTLPPVDFHSKIKLRDYQVPAARELYRMGNGGLVAPCGSGKTEIMLAVMAALKQPSLWVTHTKELLEQVIERALNCFEGMGREDVGAIASGQVSIGVKLTVSLVQTLSKIDLEPILDKFGAIFIDEGHHIAAQSFLIPLSQFPAKYRIWCSATPDREDGLTQMVLSGGGPVLYSINQADLPTLTPKIRIIETAYSGYVDVEDYAGMMGALIRDSDRNQLIVDTITREAIGHYSLVLSDRIEHLDILKTMLEDRLPEMAIEVLTGQLPKKERTTIMERARARGIDILLATKLAQEGLDLPHLDRLFLASPKKAGAATEQEVGRICRPCDHKQDSVIYDFWDTGHPVFKAQFWRRKAVYEKLGIDVNMGRDVKRLVNK